MTGQDVPPLERLHSAMLMAADLPHSLPDSGTAARLIDALQGGHEAFAAERELAKRMNAVDPGGAVWRLRHAAGYSSSAAVWAVQHGHTGVVFAPARLPPPPGLPHEAAAEASPDARFLYTSADAVVLALLRRLLDGDKRAGVYRAEMTDPLGLLTAPETVPLGPVVQVQLRQAAHFWPADYAAELMAQYAALLNPGGSLAVTLVIPSPGETGEEYMRLLGEAGLPVQAHTFDDAVSWLSGAGLELVPEGTGDAAASFGLTGWAPGRAGRPGAGRVIGVLGVKR